MLIYPTAALNMSAWLQYNQNVMGMIAEQQPADLLLREGLHQAAFGEDTPAGQTHHCPEHLIPQLHKGILTDYHANHIAANRMTLIGAGVDHEEFVAFAEKHFADLPSVSTDHIPSMF